MTIYRRIKEVGGKSMKKWIFLGIMFHITLFILLTLFGIKYFNIDREGCINPKEYYGFNNDIQINVQYNRELLYPIIVYNFAQIIMIIYWGIVFIRFEGEII